MLTAGPGGEFGAQVAIVNTSDWKIARKIDTNKESYNSGPADARFSPDGKTIVTIDDHFLSVWDVRTLKRVHQLQIPGDDDTYKDLRYLAISVDSSLVASRTEYPDRVVVWNLKTGKLLHQLESRGESRYLDFRGDTPDRKVKLLDILFRSGKRDAGNTAFH